MENARQLLAQVADQGCIGCADAHRIAAELALSPQELGSLVNRETDYRFDRCQLGLFGYGKKGTEAYKIVLPAQHCPDAIMAAIQERTIDGRVPCAALWEIAARFRYPRLGVSNIAQALGLKVKPCQLGCF
jgi:hypothetical protein